MEGASASLCPLLGGQLLNVTVREAFHVPPNEIYTLNLMTQVKFLSPFTHFEKEA